MPFHSPINDNFDYYGKLNHQGIAEAYLRDIYRSVHEKKFSFLATITGRHRVGKSVGGVAFGDLLDPTFEPNMEKRVVYTPEDFSAAVQDLADKGIIGGTIVWDEANLGLSSRDWYTQANKHINFTVQAFGFMRPIIFFVTQDVTFIDSQPRKLFHCFMEVSRSNNKYCDIRPFQVSINKRSSTMYYSYPRMTKGRHGKGQVIKLKPIRLMKPSDDLMIRYEKHSIKRKRQLMQENDDMIRHIKNNAIKEKTRERMTDEEMIDYCIAERNNPVFLNQKGEFETNTIHQELGITESKAKYIKSKADYKMKELRKVGID